MNRRAALRHNIYKDAMKGKISAQRFMYKEFERYKEQHAILQNHYDHLIFKWYINNPLFGKGDYEIPNTVQMEIASLRNVLRHYYPLSYPQYTPEDVG